MTRDTTDKRKDGLILDDERTTAKVFNETLCSWRRFYRRIVTKKDWAEPEQVQIFGDVLQTNCMQDELQTNWHTKRGQPALERLWGHKYFTVPRAQKRVRKRARERVSAAERACEAERVVRSKQCGASKQVRGAEQVKEWTDDRFHYLLNHCGNVSFRCPVTAHSLQSPLSLLISIRLHFASKRCAARMS